MHPNFIHNQEFLKTGLNKGKNFQQHSNSKAKLRFAGSVNQQQQSGLQAAKIAVAVYTLSPNENCCYWVPSIFLFVVFYFAVAGFPAFYPANC